MDAASGDDASTSVDDVTAGELEEESNKVDSLEVASSSGDALREIENVGEVLIRVELELACSSEKLINLNLLLMHVATRESDFETFLSEENPDFGNSSQKALEFDILSGILDSEVEELENFISALKMEIGWARETMASREHLGEAFKTIEPKLDDCEDSLKQSLEQLSEIKVQSANFQRIILTSGKHDKAVECFGNGYLSNLDTKIKMQTTEQQRHILRMLEKSLARELDLEKKLTESRQTEELLNLRLQEEIYFVEEEAEAAWERLLKAENLAEVLLSSSKELLSRLQIVQFTQKGSSHREEDLRSKLQDCSKQLEGKDSTLQEHERTILELRGEVKLLEEKHRESVLELQNVKDTAKGIEDLSPKVLELETLGNHLNDKNSDLEKRAGTAEEECKLLREANINLETELKHLKTEYDSASERVVQLEKQLKAADTGLQHAVASTEASQEKITMLDSTIKDMENLIDDLKLKVLKAKDQTESVEEKCILLSEANADLNDELIFVRGRLESLEASLHQAEETKQATTKEISIRTKLITDLVVQLAFERERLHKQIYSLTKDKKVMVNHLQKLNKENPVATSPDLKESSTETVAFKNDSVASRKESKDDVTDLPSTSSERCVDSASVLEREDLRKMEHDSVRNIDAWQLNFKYFVFPALVLLTSAAAAFWLRYQNDYL